MIKIEYLNHASVQIEIDDFRLLCDPWFFGTCFQEGWGLRFRNEKAINIAKTATHLWISHFHSDHFHIPTLKKILEVNANLTVLGNHSYNFKLDKAMKSIGFKNVIPIYERKKLQINSELELIRYPTTGIDNMLFIKSIHGNVLNYNDCNLPLISRKKIGNKLGSIDIFMTNFNHAGKLLIYPPKAPSLIKEELKRSFRNNYESFDVNHIFPFASHHYYRAPESQEQNSSLLTSGELFSLDSRVIDINIGETLTFDKETNKVAVQKKTHIKNEMTVIKRANQKSFEELAEGAKNYCKTLRKNYGIFCWLLPKFYIEISDINKVVSLSVQKGMQLEEQKDSISPHIKAHSKAIYKWFTSIYGTDSFVVGAHFEISNHNKIPLKWQIVIGLLIDNKLSIRDVLGMIFSISGIQFLFNRREEIMGILTERKIHADYHD